VPRMVNGRLCGNITLFPCPFVANEQGSRERSNTSADVNDNATSKIKRTQFSEPAPHPPDQ